MSHAIYYIHAGRTMCVVQSPFSVLSALMSSLKGLECNTVGSHMITQSHAVHTRRSQRLSHLTRVLMEWPACTVHHSSNMCEGSTNSKQLLNSTPTHLSAARSLLLHHSTIPDLANRNIEARFRSSDLWVMSPPRFHCATSIVWTVPDGNRTHDLRIASCHIVNRYETCALTN
jgi:hypothetical protein